MRGIRAAESPASLQILLHDRVLDLHGTVNFGLGGLLDGGDFGCLLGDLLEEFVGFLALLSLEVLIGDALNVALGDVNGGGTSDAHLLVHALERDTVEGLGTGEEQKAGVELLQENNALATEAAAEEDENLAGLDHVATLDELLLGLGGLLGKVLASNNLLARALPVGEHELRATLSVTGDHVQIWVVFLLLKNRWCPRTLR